MADEDKVIFDRKTAAVLLEVARWWQTSGMARPRPQKTPRPTGSTLRIAEVVDEDPRGTIDYGNVTVKLLHAPGEPLDARTYDDIDEGINVAAVNWLRPRGYDPGTGDNSDGTIALKIGQKVLVADMYGTWAIVGILSGQYVDLLNPEDVSNGWSDDKPGIVTTTENVDAGAPYTYVVDSLAAYLEKVIGPSPGTDASGDYVLCVHCDGAPDGPYSYLFLTPLSSL